MHILKNLKRVTDPDYLLCHRCGLPLRGAAHKNCANAALRESVGRGKEPSKIKIATSNRPYEGIGVVGTTPCRLEDGTKITPSEEARKIREEGYVHRYTGERYRPWTNGIVRERTKMTKEELEEMEESELEEEQELEQDIDPYEDETKDLFFLVHGYTSRFALERMFTSDLNVPDEIESPLDELFDQNG